MSSTSLVDYYNSRVNFDKLNPLIRSAYNTTSDFEEYKQKLLAKVEYNKQDGNLSFLDSIEDVRREQHARLEQVEYDYYNESKKATSFDVPYYAEVTQNTQEIMVTSKPPIPTASRRSPSPVFVTEEQIQHHMYDRPVTANIVRRHNDDTTFCPHRTCTIDTNVLDDTTTSDVQNHIQSMWDEFEIDDYIEKRKTRRVPSAPATTSWAGRVTVPEPFSLTNSVTMDNVHRRKCKHEIEAAKIQKEVEDELMLNRSFKANPVPAHVRMPLYEQLQEEQRVRREQVHQMTKDYLNSISKPFGFNSRETAKTIVRRHSYSDVDTARREPLFKAKPLPDFYYRTRKDIENMKEKSLYRSIKKEMRAKELLRQSRLPSNMQEREQQARRAQRSMSANDLARMGLEEYTFKPKTNGYYIPNYDKLHSQFLRQSEEAKRTRPTTKCKPFLLYTNLIQTRKDKVLDDIRSGEQMRHLQTFQIKGKQLPTKSASGMSLSASLQKPEAIPTKKTEVQREREAMGKKKRHEHEIKNKFEKNFQRSRSAKERRLRENIREQAKLQDKSTIYKAKKEENNRKVRQSMRQIEDEYARTLDVINGRVERRPLLLEQDQRDKAVRDLERNIQHAMSIAKISEKDLMRQKFNPPNVKVTATRTNYSS
ncbi:unnamed protein product [Rotaria socialis]|uniref:Uncharacterized protein n=1 Tax=Rotaria socialis TaxID=392032 RepID=A0A817PW12_9BILA|nr:unnamed protein product [Rotaria socialis]CAF3344188.1 unnamed protein product [Rotaria socialis]CAF4201079.1 unnamed protein product [Rotaria socialis]CAF4336894.1 unnamed protein product [Rotaria socialis]